MIGDGPARKAFWIALLVATLWALCTITIASETLSAFDAEWDYLETRHAIWNDATTPRAERLERIEALDAQWVARAPWVYAVEIGLFLGWFLGSLATLGAVALALGRAAWGRGRLGRVAILALVAVACIDALVWLAFGLSDTFTMDLLLAGAVAVLLVRLASVAWARGRPRAASGSPTEVPLP